MTDSSDFEEWFVQLASGDVRLMTLDELDAAFQNGLVDESTLVRRDGVAKWSKLSDEIGAAAPVEPPPPEASAPQKAVVSTRSEAPVVADISLPEMDDDFDVALRSSRKRTIIVSSVIATAVIGAFAAVTAVNVARMRTHAALAADLAAATPRVSAPSDPEPEETTKSRDDSKKKDRNVRRQRGSSQGTQQQPGSDVTKTPFNNGGDDHDPLNGKL